MVKRRINKERENPRKDIVHTRLNRNPPPENESILGLTKTTNMEEYYRSLPDHIKDSAARFRGEQKIPLPKGEKKTLRERLTLNQDPGENRKIAGLISLFRGMHKKPVEEKPKSVKIEPKKKEREKDNWFLSEEE